MTAKLRTKHVAAPTGLKGAAAMTAKLRTQLCRRPHGAEGFASFSRMNHHL